MHFLWDRFLLGGAVPYLRLPRNSKSRAIRRYVLQIADRPREPLPLTPKREITILITPWLETMVPFFSVQVGLSLKQKGHSVKFLFDLEKGFGNFRNFSELEGIIKVRAALQKVGYETIDSLKEIRLPISPSKISPTVRRFYFENLVKENNSEEKALQNYNSQKILPYVSKIARIKKTLKKFRVGELVIPGGVYGWSGAYLLACQDLEIPFWTYDSGPDFINVSRNSIASHFEEFHAALKKIRPSRLLYRRISRVVKATYRKKSRGLDSLKYMLGADTRVSKKTKSDGLILMNYRIDTAAMMPVKLFPTTQAWLTQTSEWFQKNRLRLIIRRHPCELDPQSRAADEYRYLLKYHPSRVQFFDFKEHLNTYNLIAQTRVVLPFSSRTGIEALYFGKPVVTCAKNYYRNLRGIFRARTIREYFTMIKKNLRRTKPAPLTPEVVLAAYLSEFCLFKKSAVTPMAESFKEWHTWQEGKFLTDPGFAIFLECISKNKNFIFECFLTQVHRERHLRGETP